MQVEGFKVADQKFPSPKSLNIDLMFLSCLNIGQITICFIVVQHIQSVTCERLSAECLSHRRISANVSSSAFILYANCKKNRKYRIGSK